MSDGLAGRLDGPAVSAFNITPQGHRAGDGWGGFADAGVSVTETDQAATIDGAGGSTHIVDESTADGAGRMDGAPVIGGASPCGCPWDYVDAGGFCACCHAHIDDPRGLYAEQGDGRHRLRGCPLTDTVGALKVGGGKPRQGYPAVRVDGEMSASACAFDPQPDGRRYAACGDGVVAPVAEWIGRRLLGAMRAVKEAA